MTPKLPITLIGILMSFSVAATAQNIMSAKDKQVCLAKGGKLTHFGMLQNEACEIHFRDAGKVCTDSKQCSGQCDYAKSMVNGSPKGRVKGLCTPTNNGFGCHAEVRKGRVSGSICVD